MSARRLLLATALTATLASCGGGSDIRDTLGLNRKAPDEFRVYARPALTVPPEFSLRAPGTPSDAPTTMRADDAARSTVMGDPAAMPVASSTAVSPVTTSEIHNAADAQFLQNAGAAKANPQVRSTIQTEVENGLTTNNSQYLINTSADGEPVVDAAKEAERLKQNKAENKSPTTGDTPVIEPKNKGILGSIGDWF